MKYYPNRLPSFSCSKKLLADSFIVFPPSKKRKKKRAAQPDLRSYATRCIHDYSIFPENRKGSFAQIGQKKIDESGEKAYDISKI